MSGLGLERAFGAKGCDPLGEVRLLHLDGEGRHPETAIADPSSPGISSGSPRSSSGCRSPASISGPSDHASSASYVRFVSGKGSSRSHWLRSCSPKNCSWGRKESLGHFLSDHLPVNIDAIFGRQRQGFDRNRPSYIRWEREDRSRARSEGQTPPGREARLTPLLLLRRPSRWQTRLTCIQIGCIDPDKADGLALTVLVCYFNGVAIDDAY